MRHGQVIGVVIPALNEVNAIGKVLAEIPEWVDHVVVADNGSSDGTGDIARARVARSPDEIATAVVRPNWQRSVQRAPGRTGF